MLTLHEYLTIRIAELDQQIKEIPEHDLDKETKENILMGAAIELKLLLLEYGLENVK